MSRRLSNLHNYCTNLIDNNFCKLPNYFICEKNMKLKPHLSPSQVSDWMRCRRRYLIRNIYRIVRKDAECSSAVKKGKLWDVINNRIHGDKSESIQDVIFRYEIDPYDIAQVKALYRAHKVFINVDSNCIPQNEKYHTFEETNLKGIVDRDYSDHFIETKLSSRPANYDDRFSIALQAGSYFILEPEYEYCVYEVTQTPQQKILKAGKGRQSKETAEEYEERIYSDILSRPSNYFMGLNRNKGTFGFRKLMRSDFQLDELLERYILIRQEIESLYIPEDKDMMLRNFYKQETGCFAYNELCEYRSICEKPSYCNIPENLYIDGDKQKEDK